MLWWDYILWAGKNAYRPLPGKQHGTFGKMTDSTIEEGWQGAGALAFDREQMIQERDDDFLNLDNEWLKDVEEIRN